jgi:hypothetical protein
VYRAFETGVIGRMSTRTQRDRLEILRRSSPRTGARLIVDHCWSRSVVLVLRCDLSVLPPERPAKVSVVMREADPRTFNGFAQERGRVQGGDLMEVAIRERLAGQGLEALYVATSEAGDPVYAQWLVRPNALRVADSAFPGMLLPPSPEQVLIEGAYTFSDFRGMRAMADGMGQLLRIARNEGYRWAVTNVADGNIASLRGCARVGFELDHRLVVTHRFGRRRIVAASNDADARRQWQTATAGHTGR